MRIVITNTNLRLAGGAEIYLDTIIPAICEAGHEIALLGKMDGPADRPRIGMRANIPVWCLAGMGAPSAFRELKAWRPDLIYAHGLDEPMLDAEALAVAPNVFFAHGYHGTCISGGKSFSYPVARPCVRHFGWQCFAHFYPHRCGGLNPLTMWREYSRQETQLRLLKEYRAILTASDHMRREYLKHGFAEGIVHLVPLPVCSSRVNGSSGYASLHSPLAGRDDGWRRETSEHAPGAKSNEDEWRLLFAGRMTKLKGGAVLLDAIPGVAAALDRPVRVTFAGEGPAREDLEAQGRVLAAHNPNLRIEFVGWLDADALDALAKSIHLLVMPSLWPEPFGLAGPEFGLKGIPAAAFAVGGVPEWLTDGINGCLAPGDPPTAHGLAAAITRCLHDSDKYARLRRGAVVLAQRFSLARHLETLMTVFGEAAGSANGDA